MEKNNLKSRIAFEKSQMLPLNFFMAYVITPIYLALCVICILAFMLFMSMDENKYLVPGLLCLGFFVILSAAVLLMVPYVRREGIKTELQQQFLLSTEGVPELEVYEFSGENFTIKFDKFGMYYNDKLSYYNHMKPIVKTGNYCKRVNIEIIFPYSEDEVFTFKLIPTVLKMLEVFDIKLENQQILDYILTHTEDAFRQIYDKGYVIPRLISTEH